MRFVTCITFITCITVITYITFRTYCKNNARMQPRFEFGVQISTLQPPQYFFTEKIQNLIILEQTKQQLFVFCHSLSNFDPTNPFCNLKCVKEKTVIFIPVRSLFDDFS